MAITTAIIAGTALVAGAANTYVQTEDKKNVATNVNNKAKEDQTKLLDDTKARAQKEQQDQADAASLLKRNRDAATRRATLPVPGGKNGTILTSPLGLPGDGQPTQRKTLLGA